MPIESCTQSLCDLALRFGEDSDEAGMVSLQRRTGHPHGFLNLPHPPPLLTHLHQVASTSPTGGGRALTSTGAHTSPAVRPACRTYVMRAFVTIATQSPLLERGSH